MPRGKVQKASGELFYWNQLSQLLPDDICYRTGAMEFHPLEGFLLPVYHLRYLIIPKTRNILRVEGYNQVVKEDVHPFFALMVLVYLTSAKVIEPEHKWVSERDLKGGANFFRGPHSLQLKELEDLYGKDPEAFLEAGRSMGGKEISFAYKSFALNVFPKIPLAYLLWEGDEEFSPKFRVLFDSTIQSHLPLDIIWAMVAETSRRLARQNIG